MAESSNQTLTSDGKFLPLSTREFLRKTLHSFLDVKQMLTKYLNNEVRDLKEIGRKACLKVLLSDLLCLSIAGISNKNRTTLYNFILNKIHLFKQGNPDERDVETLKQHLGQNVKIQIDEFLKEDLQQTVKVEVKVEKKGSDTITNVKIEPPKKMEEGKNNVSVAASDSVSTSDKRKESSKELLRPSTSNEKPKGTIEVSRTSDKTVEAIYKAPETTIKVPAETNPFPDPVPDVQDTNIGTIDNDVRSEQKRKSRNKKRRDSKEASVELMKSDDSVAQETASTSSSDLTARASSIEFQPNVSLNSNEWEIELEKLNKKKAEKIESEKAVPVIPITVPNETNAGSNPPMVEIPASVLESSDSRLQEIEKTGTKPKPKKKKQKTEAKKIKQRRPTHKDQVNPHYNIEKFLARIDSSHPNRETSSLFINIVPTKLCNYSFQLHQKSLDLSMTVTDEVPTQPVSGLDINQLLYWPGVGVKLSLPEMEIIRYCNANVRRELVPPFAILEKDDKIKNRTSLFRFYKNKTIQSISPPEKDVELSQLMILTYLELVVKALSISKFSKQEELNVVLKAFLSDFSKTSVCCLKTSFSYFCGNYPYYRVFHPKTQQDENMEGLVLRENYNPEIVFTITRCSFESNGNFNASGLTDYFKSIIVDKNLRAIHEFNIMLNKGFSVHCVDCKDDQNGQFSGPIKMALLSEHIGNVCANVFTCVKCIFREKIEKLSGRQWKHKCVMFKDAK